ncbi:MAG: 6-phosphogluconolactonase [Candidatus Eisenbacteria bacterium]
MSLRLFADADALAAAAAADLAACARAAITTRGRFDVAVSGGRTPAGLFAKLVTGDLRGAPEIECIQVWFADERAVPPDHPDSNYRMVREALLLPLGWPLANVHRMEADREDLEAAAAGYARALPSRLDLVVLGIGEDGHTASLFPGSPLVAEEARTVAAVYDAPKPPARRLTLTPPVLAAARRLMMLASGEGKADAVARALSESGDTREVPARLARGRDWYLDRAAAAHLPAGIAG